MRGRYEAATQAKNPVCVVMKREDEMSRYDPWGSTPGDHCQPHFLFLHATFSHAIHHPQRVTSWLVHNVPLRHPGVRTLQLICGGMYTHVRTYVCGEQEPRARVQVLSLSTHGSRCWESIYGEKRKGWQLGWRRKRVEGRGMGGGGLWLWLHHIKVESAAWVESEGVQEEMLDF